MAEIFKCLLVNTETLNTVVKDCYEAVTSS